VRRRSCRHLGRPKRWAIKSHFESSLSTRQESTSTSRHAHLPFGFHAPTWPTAPAEKTWCRLGIAAGKVPREGVKVCRERGTNVLHRQPTSATMGLRRLPSRGIERANRQQPTASTSPFDIDCIAPVSWPVPAWPEPGGPAAAARRLSLLEKGPPLIWRHVRGLRPRGGGGVAPLTTQRHEPH